MSDSVRSHRRQPTRLPRPWDSPSKNTAVGYHFLLRCMEVKSESQVAQSCPTLSDPMDCSLPGSSIHGIFQARVLEWIAISSSTMEYYSAIKKNTFDSVLMRWLKLESIILSEISQKEKHLPSGKKKKNTNTRIDTYSTLMWHIDKYLYINAYMHNVDRSMYCCSVPKSCPALCDPMDCSTPDCSIYTSKLNYMVLFSGKKKKEKHQYSVLTHTYGI